MIYNDTNRRHTSARKAYTCQHPGKKGILQKLNIQQQNFSGEVKCLFHVIIVRQHYLLSVNNFWNSLKSFTYLRSGYPMDYMGVIGVWN